MEREILPLDNKPTPLQPVSGGISNLRVASPCGEGSSFNISPTKYFPPPQWFAGLSLSIAFIRLNASGGDNGFTERPMNDYLKVEIFYPCSKSYLFDPCHLVAKHFRRSPDLVTHTAMRLFRIKSLRMFWKLEFLQAKKSKKFKIRKKSSPAWQ